MKLYRTYSLHCLQANTVGSHYISSKPTPRSSQLQDILIYLTHRYINSTHTQLFYGHYTGRLVLADILS